MKNSRKKYTSFCGLLLVIFLTGIANVGAKAPAKKSEKWVGTWSTAPMLVEPANMPPAPGLNNNTIRQIVRVSIGGECLKLKFSNEFGNSAVTLKKVQIAVSKGEGLIDTCTIKELSFDGKAEVAINPGTAIASDEVLFHLKPRMDVAITIYFGETSKDLTGHPGSRTTSYIFAGNKVSSTDTSGVVKTDHWYIISGIDVKAPKTAASVAILGNSITDGRGSVTNKQNRWPDVLSERLLANSKTQQIGVLNLGIGGNCVLKNCLGPAAVDRFERDILRQQGVRWLIILEGVNDLGQAPDSLAAVKTANDLISAYKQMIEKAHANNIKVFGATILPINKSFYYTSYREAARKMVNDWIRSGQYFDAVIDFDKVMQNPEDISTLLPDLHMGDFLHPNEKGYQKMGIAVDLKLFE
ncbi:MAG TPA: SGNH/GDSL hydrolase family protein [Bacteroidales bacterium]|nr:SGNH/GDSL hydrolase family protein [Bacteroidales bacterium]